MRLDRTRQPGPGACGSTPASMALVFVAFVATIVVFVANRIPDQACVRTFCAWP